MATKDQLIALATAFGIITEGLNAKELQERLDASDGYKMYQEALAAKVAAEKSAEDAIKSKTEAETTIDAAEARATELERDLNAAKETISYNAAEINTAKDALCIEIEKGIIAKKKVAELEQALADATVAEEDNRILFESEDGNTYEIVVEKFRHAGIVYQSAQAVEQHKDILEAQIAAKSFILKKV